MRITAELLQTLAEQRVNPCSERELVLRGLNLQQLEHLGACPGQISALDLSHNHIQRLENFTPKLSQLSTLHAAHNVINSLDMKNVQRYLPNLKTLTLCHNHIRQPAVIWRLAQSLAGTLDFLSLQHNPICTQQPHYRLLVIYAFDQACREKQEEQQKQKGNNSNNRTSTPTKTIQILRTLDYQRIRPAERKRAQKWSVSTAGRAVLEQIQDAKGDDTTAKTFVPGDALPSLMDDDEEEEEATANVTELTAEQKDVLRQILQACQSEAEMQDIQTAVLRQQRQHQGRTPTQEEVAALTQWLQDYRDKQQQQQQQQHQTTAAVTSKKRSVPVDNDNNNEANKRQRSDN